MVQFLFNPNSGGDFEIYEEGDYPARLSRWEEVESSYLNKDGTPQKRLRLDWTFLDEDGHPSAQGMPTWVGSSFGPKSTLTKIVKVLLNKTDAELLGFGFDMDDLLEHDCILEVTIGEKLDKTPCNKVENYRSLQRKTPTVRPVAIPVGAAPARAQARPAATAPAF